MSKTTYNKRVLNCVSETEEKLTNKINTLLSLKSGQNLNGESKDDKNEASLEHKKFLLSISSNSIKENPANIDISANQEQHNLLQSQYAEAMQNFFQNAKSTLVKDKEKQGSPQTSEDQLALGSFNKGESLALLATASDKKIEVEKTEKPDILVEATKPHLNNNFTASSIINSKNLDPNSQHKQSAGKKFLASMSPEEFLKRLKKHLEISKSNLKILKKNFHDFLKEKEKLFRLNQKVSQEHPHVSQEFNMSVIRTHDDGQIVSFAQESKRSEAFPTVNYPQPISQICPKDCPVNMIHIEHHHHGNSPIPCICENENLYFNMREDASLSGIYIYIYVVNNVEDYINLFRYFC